MFQGGGGGVEAGALWVFFKRGVRGGRGGGGLGEGNARDGRD
jgi:hypothetical protein